MGESQYEKSIIDMNLNIAKFLKINYEKTEVQCRTSFISTEFIFTLILAEPLFPLERVCENSDGAAEDVFSSDQYA